MTGIKDILAGLSRPLSFAAHNDWAGLAILRDIERTFGAQLREAEGSASVQERRAIEQMLGLLRGMDSLPMDEKKPRMKQFAALFARLAAGDIGEPPPEKPAQTPPAQPAQAPAMTAGTPVQYIKGVGPVLAEKLASRGLHTAGDLLRFYPGSYEDRRNLARISELSGAGTATVTGRVSVLAQSGRRAWEMLISDGTGYLSLKWFHFNQRFIERLKNEFAPGSDVVASGKVSFFRDRPQIVHPEMRKAEAFEADDLNYRRIVPLYPKTEGVSEGHFLRIMQRAVDGAASDLVDPLPERLRSMRNLIEISRAVKETHFPPDDADMETVATTRSPARRRLAYDELFFLELGMARRRARTAVRPGISFRVGGDAAEVLRGIVPFELTGAQKKVIREIGLDMQSSSPMNRLIQGDVGSGKTAVAFAAMLIAARNGYQSAMLAPTEILASQHMRSVERYASGAGAGGGGRMPKVVLLTGSVKGVQRREVLQLIASGGADIVVGTHAVIEEPVTFRRLGLAVIDEQHRFGVMQRAAV
ncbi:MAG: DEAD/DEAH box helicase, partial [Myxococcota bacterium]